MNVIAALEAWDRIHANHHDPETIPPLIEAATDLLKACKLAEQFIALDCDCSESDDDGNPLKELRAAIVKAQASPTPTC